MTNPQDRAIQWFLWKKPTYITENDWLSYDDYLKIKPEIDIGTASTVIGLFKGNKPELAINQLKHLL